MARTVVVTVPGTPAVGTGAAANTWRAAMTTALEAKRAELVDPMTEMVGVDARFRIAGAADTGFTRQGPALARLTTDLVDLLVPTLIDAVPSIVGLKAVKLLTTGEAGLIVAFITRD